MSEEAAPIFFMKAYLWARDINWSEEQVEELQNRFADFLVENGFGSKEGAELINSVVVIGQEDHPDDPGEFLRAITRGEAENTVVTCIMIPKEPT